MEMEVANAALEPMWSANAAWPILYGNPLHRPVTKWAKTSTLNKCHQDAQADFSLLLLSGSAFDMQGDEFPEISCCHLVFPTAGHLRNFLTSTQLYIWGTSAALLEVWPVHGSKKSPGVFYSISFLSRAKRELSGLSGWSLVKHIKPFYMFTGESTYCLRFTVYFPRFALGDRCHGTGTRRVLPPQQPPRSTTSTCPKSCFWPQILWVSAGKVLEAKTLAKQMGRKQQPR